MKTASELYDEMMLARSQEKAKLLEDIRKLAPLREKAIEDTKKAVQDADTAQARLKTVIEATEAIMAIHADASRETLEFIGVCEALMRDCGAKLKEMAQWGEMIEKKAVECAQTLADTQERARVIHEIAVAEEATMQRNREDLDIYHSRLKAYFKEYLPDQQIIL